MLNLSNPRKLHCLPVFPSNFKWLYCIAFVFYFVERKYQICPLLYKLTSWSPHLVTRSHSCGFTKFLQFMHNWPAAVKNTVFNYFSLRIKWLFLPNIKLIKIRKLIILYCRIIQRTCILVKTGASWGEYLIWRPIVNWRPTKMWSII